MATVGQWVHSSDGTVFESGGSATREAAVDAGKAVYDGKRFYVAQVTAVASKVSDFMDDSLGRPVAALAERCKSLFGVPWESEGEVSSGFAEELANSIRVKIDQWADLHNLHPKQPCPTVIGEFELIEGGPANAEAVVQPPPKEWVRDNGAISECLLMCLFVVNRDQVAEWTDGDARAAHEWATAVIHNSYPEAARVDVPVQPTFLDRYPTRVAKPTTTEADARAPLHHAPGPAGAAAPAQPTEWLRDNNEISGDLLLCGIVVSREQVSVWSYGDAICAGQWAAQEASRRADFAKGLVREAAIVPPAFLDGFPTRVAEPAAAPETVSPGQGSQPAEGGT